MFPSGASIEPSSGYPPAAKTSLLAPSAFGLERIERSSCRRYGVADGLLLHMPWRSHSKQSQKKGKRLETCLLPMKGHLFGNRHVLTFGLHILLPTTNATRTSLWNIILLPSPDRSWRCIFIITSNILTLLTRSIQHPAHGNTAHDEHEDHDHSDSSSNDSACR